MKILSRYTNACRWEGEAETMRDAVIAATKAGVDLTDADLTGADLTDAILRGAILRGADLRDAILRDAILRGADLTGADLRDAILTGAKIKALRCFSGLYQYQIWVMVLEDGSPWVRMGCQWRSVEEWDRITIRESRTSEFPNDGSDKSEQRARAFEFARNEAVLMAAKFAEAPCTP
jgi:hypothetical protein